MKSRLRMLLHTLQRAIEQFQRHRTDLLGAGLSFFALLSLAPLLVVAVAVAGFVWGEGPERREALSAVSRFLSPKASALVNTWIESAYELRSEATAIGLVLFLFAASRSFVQLKSALEAIWEIEVRVDVSFWQSVKSFVTTHLAGLALALGMAAVFAGSLAAQYFIREGLAPLLDHLFLGEIIATFMQGILIFAVLWLVCTTVYRTFLHVRIGWKDAALGAALTSGLSVVGAVLVRFYFAHVGVDPVYGAAGSVIAVLLWLYFCAQIFLFGVELSAVIAHTPPEQMPSDTPEQKKRRAEDTVAHVN